MFSKDQMKEYLSTQYGYSLENIPLTLGGSFEPTTVGEERYKSCYTTVKDSRSACSSYYTLEHQPINPKSSSNILYFNTDHHHSDASKSLVAIVALRRNHDVSSSGMNRPQKRESSASSDSEKRRRSNESLIEENDDEINGCPAKKSTPSGTIDE